MAKKVKAATALEIERAEKVGRANGLVPMTKLPGATVQVEIEYLNKGDIFEIPGRDVKAHGNPKFKNAPCLRCVFANGDVRDIYISTFTKSAIIVDEECVPTGAIEHCDGSFVDEWRKSATNDEAWTALAGREVEVKDVRSVNVRRYGTNEVRSTSLYTFELLPK